jgi:hypothetical protein
MKKIMVILAMLLILMTSIVLAENILIPVVYDGSIENDWDSTWDLAHDHSGTALSQTNGVIQIEKDASAGYNLRRMGVAFNMIDFQNLGDVEIQKAELSAYKEAGAVSGTDDGYYYVALVRGVTTTNPTHLVVGDFDTLGAVDNPVVISNHLNNNPQLPNGQRHIFQISPEHFDMFENEVLSNGYLWFAIRGGHDINDTAIGSNYVNLIQWNDELESNPMYLNITYTQPSNESLFFDDFNRADQHGLGTNWTQYNQNYPSNLCFIRDNKAFCTEHTSGNQIHNHLSAYTDLTDVGQIDFKVSIDSNLDGQNFGIHFATASADYGDSYNRGANCMFYSAGFGCVNGTSMDLLFDWGTIVVDQEYEVSYRNIDWMNGYYDVYVDDVSYGTKEFSNLDGNHHFVYYHKGSSSQNYSSTMDDIYLFANPPLPAPELPEGVEGTVFCDQFNRNDSADLGSDWSESVPTSTAVDYSVKNHQLFIDMSTSVADNNLFYEKEVNFGDVNRIDFKVNISDNYNLNNPILKFVNDGNTVRYQQCSIGWSNTLLRCYNGASYESFGGTVVENQEYTISFREIDWIGRSMKIYIDDVFVGNHLTWNSGVPTQMYIHGNGYSDTGELWIDNLCGYGLTQGTFDGFDRADNENIAQDYDGILEFTETPLQNYSTAPYNGNNETVILDGKMLITDTSYCDAHAVVVSFGDNNELVTFGDGYVTMELENGVMAGSSDNWENYIGFGENLDQYMAQEVDCEGQSLVTMFDPFDRTYGLNNRRFCKLSYYGDSGGNDRFAVDCGGAVTYVNLPDANNGKNHWIKASFNVLGDRMRLWLNGYYVGEFEADLWTDNSAKINSIAFVTKTNQGGVTQYMEVDNLIVNIVQEEPKDEDLTLFTDLVDGTYDYNARNITINYNGSIDTVLPQGLDNQLTRYFSFDSDTISGNNVEDLTGTLDATMLNNPATGESGVLGESMNFSTNYGSSNVLDLGNGFTYTNNVSYSIWTYATDGVTINQEIFSYLGHAYRGYLQQDGNDMYAYFVANPQSPIVTCNNCVDLNTWTMWSVTASIHNTNQGTLKLYKNGQLVSNQTLTLSPVQWYGYNRKDAIGGRGQPITNIFDGSVDEFAFWNRELSASEVSDLYDHYNTFSNSTIFDCSLYMNEVLNQTSTDVNVSTNQQFFVKWGNLESKTNFKIHCENDETFGETITYNYIVDTVEPRIVSPFIPYSEFEVKNNEIIEFDVSVYDPHLTITNVSLEGSSGVIDNYYNGTHNDTGVETHYESLLYNATVLGTGNYTFRVYGKNFVNENEKTYPFEVTQCQEVWSPYTTDCSLFTYTQTLLYEDLNECGTTYDLPATNGSTIPCTVGYCNTTQITSEGRGKSEEWIYENDCISMTMSKNYYTPTIELIDKQHVGVFKLMLFGIEEREVDGNGYFYTPFASMKLQSNVSGGYLAYENEQVSIGYVINETRFKTVMTVKDWDYRIQPDSELWVKILYKKGAHQYIQWLAPVVDGVEMDLEYTMNETGVNFWAHQNIFRGDFIELDPVIICLEDWQAQYSACTVGDNQTLTYVDANLCGTYGDLPANNGTLVSCNYCSSDWQYDYTACTDWRTVKFPTTDLNQGTCCNVTGLENDCSVPANTTQSCAGIHSSSDVPSVVIDFISEFGIQLIALVGVIALVGIFFWVRGRFK